MRFYNKDCDPSQLSPLTLAFVGDSVFDLFPAYAGVIPITECNMMGYFTFPRIRGGDPSLTEWAL